MKRAGAAFVLALMLLSAAPPLQADESEEFDRTILPIPEPPFRGRIGLTPADSEKDFPRQPVAPEGAPHVPADHDGRLRLCGLGDVRWAHPDACLRPRRQCGAGKHELFVRFDYTGGDEPGKPVEVELLVDGASVAKGRVERTIPIRISLDETLDIGEDTGTPVSEDYEVPFRFTGELETVTTTLR